MDTPMPGGTLHVALKYVAAACIDENMLAQAETMAAFLELVKVAPRTVGLVQVWTLSQRGHLRDALRHCEELSENYPDAPEFQPLLAVLRYACNEPMWRAVCDRLLASADSSAESKRLATSLIEGTFGKKPPEEPDAAAEAPEPAIDYAAMSGYMRA
jgi:hypothetical protein